MSRIEKTASQPLGLGTLVAVLTTPARLGALLRVWTGRRRSRRALAQLDGHLMRDIGLDALTADAEATQPFWK